MARATKLTSCIIRDPPSSQYIYVGLSTRAILGCPSLRTFQINLPADHNGNSPLIQHILLPILITSMPLHLPLLRRPQLPLEEADGSIQRLRSNRCTVGVAMTLNHNLSSPWLRATSTSRNNNSNNLRHTSHQGWPAATSNSPFPHNPLSTVSSPLILNSPWTRCQTNFRI